MKDTEKLQILQDVISLKSVNDNETAVTDYLVRLLANYGIKAERIEELPGRFGLVAEIGNGQHPKLGLSGHLDTVTAGDPDTWQTPPFEAVVAGDKVYGRGVTDMKAGVVQFVITLIELKQQNLPETGTLRLLATVSEELTEQGAHYLASNGYGDDLDAIIFAEPTGVALPELENYFNSGGAKIAPDELNTLIKVSKRSQSPEQHFIVNAHKGWMTYTVTAKGKAAHSSMPKLGINAIDCLVQYFVAEKALYDGLTETNALLGETVYSPGLIRGGQQVNSVPDLAFEKVKVRTIPELINNDLIAKLQDLIDRLNQQPEIELTLTVEQSELPVANDNRTQLVPILQQEAAVLEEPRELPVIGVSLGTDASEFRRYNPKADMIVLGPGNTSAHQSNEYVHLSVFYNMLTLFKRTALIFLNDQRNTIS